MLGDVIVITLSILLPPLLGTFARHILYPRNGAPPGSVTPEPENPFVSRNPDNPYDE